MVLSALLLITRARPSEVHDAPYPRPSDRTLPSSGDESYESSTNPTSFEDRIRRNISEHGGIPIFICRLLQLLGCIALLGLSIAIINEREAPHRFIDTSPTQAQRFKNELHRTDDEWLGLVTFLFYVRIPFSPTRIHLLSAYP